MTEGQKRGYRAMAFLFLGVATGFSAVALAEYLFSFDFFSGNVLPLALFLGIIGALLLQTVQQSETLAEPDELAEPAEPDTSGEFIEP